MTELCRRFGVSRKTGYKWLTRYCAGGLDALDDQPRVRHGQHAKTPPEVEALVVEARQQAPDLGAAQAGPVDRQAASLTWRCPRPRPSAPSSSATGSWSRAGGGGSPRTRAADRSSPTHRATCGRPTTRASSRPGDGVYCYPLHGLRRALALHPRLRRPRRRSSSTARSRPSTASSESTVCHAAIRTDNGVPVRHAGDLRTEPPERVVDQARHHARPDRAGKARSRTDSTSGCTGR